MSHVARISLIVKDLQALGRAATELGAHLEPATTYNSYQKGLPCDYKIRLPGKEGAYEVGVIAKPDGTYDLMFDEFAGGHGMVAVIGEGACHLKQEYAAAVSTDYYQAQGYVVSRSIEEDGRIILNATR